MQIPSLPNPLCAAIPFDSPAKTLSLYHEVTFFSLLTSVSPSLRGSILACLQQTQLELLIDLAKPHCERYNPPCFSGCGSAR